MKLKCNKIVAGYLNTFFLLQVAVIMIALSGCKLMGIRYSTSGASTEGLKTVSIVYFQNRASLVQPSLSQALTDALIDKCKAQTNLAVTNDLGDANFEGEITDYNTKPLTVSAAAEAAVNRFTITVKVKYTNSIDPTLSYEQSFSRYKDYDSSSDLSQVEDDLSKQIVDELVEDIFNKAFVNW
jgi:Lipopolysaccharide-assembly